MEEKDEGRVRSLVQSYIEGLTWVLEYYHNGCNSWTWYFPHLYCPLATDMRNLADIKCEFEEGAPFTPLMQLLSVLPPQSSSFLPPKYTELMIDEKSPIIENYPLDFDVDANGKKNSWESIVRIPFIDETALLDALSVIDHKTQLSETERLRNIVGHEHRFRPPQMLTLDEARARNKRYSNSWGNAESALSNAGGDRGRSGGGIGNRAGGGRGGGGGGSNFKPRRKY